MAFDQKAYDRARRRKRKAEGICYSCDDDAEPGRVYCEYHRALNLENQRENRAFLKRMEEKR